MSKRILVTSTDLMMIQFLVPHVMNLAEYGFEVEIACSDVGGRMDEVREKLKDSVHAIHVVRLVRNPAKLKNMQGYCDLKKLIEKGHYDIVWTNEPVMGVMTRLAARKARKNGTKVLYMVHGFHFFKGAPLKYWSAFYPVEKLMLHFTDTICTVNREDYSRAKKMGARDVRYIHGIGINTSRLTLGEDKKDIREELGLSETDLLVLSIGELNENKNQKVIIEALYQLNDPDIHYILCGKGDQLETLQKLAVEYGLEKQVHFLGYRTDVVDICSRCDIYVMPSLREGLPVSSLEAMYCGLPLVTSNIRGLVDIMENGKTGYLSGPMNVNRFAKAIKALKDHKQLREKMGQYNRRVVVPYCLDHTKEEVLNLFSDGSPDQKKPDSEKTVQNHATWKNKAIIPKISVIMGIYNCADTLPAAIESIIHQTEKDWELIICNDGSTDNSLETAKKYEAEFPQKILVIDNLSNKGLNYTLNHCLQYANGEYIARMDGDDVCDPERFMKELKVFEEEPDIDIVSSDMDYFDETGTWGLVQHPAYPTKKDFIRETPFCHAPCMVRKEAYDAVNGYSVDKHLLRVEDYHLWYKMYLAGFKGKNIHEALYSMRDDRNAKNRRKFKYRINESYVKLLIVKDFKLKKINYIYVLKPIIVGLLPSSLYDFLHKLKLQR